MKNAIVFGAGGFIGSHLVKRLKAADYHVIGADLKYPEFSETAADVFFQGDLRDASFVKAILPENCDEVYQLASDMGGAGYVFTGKHDADIMHNSAQINLNVAKTAVEQKVKMLFYSSSACMYPEYNQLDPQNPKCSEDSAYPAAPDSEYGWEKLFSERMYLAFRRNYGLNVKIARFHNIYGPEGNYENGREKAPAAFCRKVLQAANNGSIELWGDGLQTRSFLYIDDCLDALMLLTQSTHFHGPVNIGSEEMVTINDFAKMIIELSDKQLEINHIDGPLGVRGRSSDNRLIEQELGWRPKYDLKSGIALTYQWIEKQLKEKQAVQ